MLTLLTRLDAVKALQHLLLKAQAAEKKAIQYLLSHHSIECYLPMKVSNN